MDNMMGFNINQADRGNNILTPIAQVPDFLTESDADDSTQLSAQRGSPTATELTQQTKCLTSCHPNFPDVTEPSESATGAALFTPALDSNLKKLDIGNPSGEGSDVDGSLKSNICFGVVSQSLIPY